MSPIRNTFAEQSEAYASSRPRYPEELFEWLAAQCNRHDMAWDCAAGSGQAALGLAAHFGTVRATDISEAQVAHGLTAVNVEYDVRSAEESGFADDTFDLVVVAQALHWFDYARFWPEVMRVARKDAFFCAWGYDWLATTAQVDAELVRPFKEIIAPYWAPNNRVLWDGYGDEDIRFPFERIEPPAMSLTAAWTVRGLLDYMCTWSAYKTARGDRESSSALDALLLRNRDLIAGRDLVDIRMPLKFAAGRVSGR